MTTLKINGIMAIIAAAGLTVGCASGPDRVADDYGNSVRAMQRAQTADPLTLISSDTTPVEHTDGQRMERSLQSYREGTSNPENTSRPIQLNIDD